MLNYHTPKRDFFSVLLCASDRYGKDWTDQQYLDRQDHYTLVFYVPAPSSNYSMDARIKVNNWVLNLQNTDLGK